MKRNAFAATAALTFTLVHATGVASEGATAPYNEAVTIVNGKRVVDVRTVPPHMRSLLSNFTKPGEGISSTYYGVETESGLMDCSQAFFHPSICVPSDYGKVIRSREWVVKISGTWQSCIGRTQPIKCIPLVADGKLRVLPMNKE
jgi:hypothetical protein